MPGQGLSPTERHDSRARARVIYDGIKGRLDPSFKGKILAIEVESGEHFIGDTVLEAARKARAKHPDKVFHFFRIGFPTVYVWRWAIMIQGWLREDQQAVVELEVVCSDRRSHTVPAIIDTGFNGQVSLPRRVVDELEPLLTYEGTVEVELASGMVIEEDVYSGTIRFDGQEVTAEIIITDSEETLIGTGLLTGKVLLVNFATREVIVRDHVP
jgi:clan AA aspartic protease